MIAEDMPPAFSSSMQANDLLRNTRTDGKLSVTCTTQQHPEIGLVPLGPFDGRVAAIHTQYPNFYITTPNQDDIFAPPTSCNVYARLDGRYGPDDHTQWPQPFSHSVPYLCCVPKKDGLAA